jgi:Flp pilus assembly protein TadD
MNVEIRSRVLGRLLLGLAVVAFLLALVWIGKAYVAQRLAEQPSVHNLQLAIKLDPGNAEYHIQLGRLYEFVPATADSVKAVEQFKRAAELSPYNPAAWLNLALASEFQGNVEQAVQYLQKTDYLAPRLPEYQWPIGNSYLLHNNTHEAFRHFKVVLAGTREYDQLIYRMAWKASGDPKVVLQDLIPDDLGAEFSYLSYLMTQHQYEETQPVWQRIINGKTVFTPQHVGGYIDGLISAHEPGRAFQVWTDLERKGIVRYASPGPNPNLVTNGDFEDQMLDLGFAWRIIGVDGAYAGLDTSNYHSPAHSMLVAFTGKQNLSYRYVFQYVKVNPSTSYRLQGFMMTDGITTDSGPRLEVRDAYDARALDQMTPDMVGTSNGWSPLLLDFKTGPKTELIILSLTRLPSQKLDNMIAGKVWLDDIRLTPLEE